MVLDFGGSQLFKTSNEERWKGVNSERLQDFPSAASSVASGETAPSVWTATPAEITLAVKADEKVVIIAAGVGDMDSANDRVWLEVLRDDVTRMGPSAWIQETDTTAEIYAGMSINHVDEPGEGIFKYTIYIKSNSGNSDVWSMCLTGFVLTVQ